MVSGWTLHTVESDGSAWIYTDPFGQSWSASLIEPPKRLTHQVVAKTSDKTFDTAGEMLATFRKRQRTTKAIKVGEKM